MRFQGAEINPPNRSSLLFTLALVLACTVPGAAPPGVIPVCCTTGVGVASEAVLQCRRADTRVVVTPVPAGFYLHLTDIIVNPNNVATTGTFTALIGRDDASAFPVTPSLDLIGSPAQQLHFSNPYLVFGPGESMSIANVAASAFPIDVRAAGYLSPTIAP